VEGEGLHVTANSIQGSHASGLGEGTWLEGDGDILEQERRGSGRKVVTYKTDIWQVFRGDLLEQRITAIVV
jgi:hypothetical protein